MATLTYHSLKDFVEQAVIEINNGCSPTRFIELRYDIMGRLWPTGIWSTNEVRLDIFQEILDYITGKTEIPKYRPRIDNRKVEYDEYWDNFRNWILKHKHEG